MRVFPLVRAGESLEPAFGTLKYSLWQQYTMFVFCFGLFFFFKFDILGQVCQSQFNNKNLKIK